MADTKQYNPIPSTCTDTDDALSVRMIRDMADSINNYCIYVGNHKLIGQPAIPEWQSHDATTEERVIHPFVHRNVPDGHLQFLMILKHYRFTGTADIVWRLYCHTRFYTGPVILDTDSLGPGYTVGTITTTLADHKRSTTKFNIVRGRVGMLADICYFTLTAQNGDVSSRGAITAIDVWPYIPMTEATS